MKIEDKRIYQDVLKHEMVEIFTNLKNEAITYAGMSDTKVLLIFVRWIGFDVVVPQT